MYLRSVQRTTLPFKPLQTQAAEYAIVKTWININRWLFGKISPLPWGRRKFIKVILTKILWLTWYDVKYSAQSFGQKKTISFSGHSLRCFRFHGYFENLKVRIDLNIKMIKKLTSNPSYFIVCKTTCFGSYVTIIRPFANQVNKCWLHVGIPKCSQHLLNWFVRRPDDGHIRTETCSLTHNKMWCVWRKLFYHFNIEP